jgi:hypothetical protein
MSTNKYMKVTRPCLFLPGSNTSITTYVLYYAKIQRFYYRTLVLKVFSRHIAL